MLKSKIKPLICKSCDAPLVEGKNWIKTPFKGKLRQCYTCYCAYTNERNKINKKKREERAKGIFVPQYTKSDTIDSYALDRTGYQTMKYKDYVEALKRAKGLED